MAKAKKKVAKRALSDKPWEAIEQALEDLRAVEKNPNYFVNMDRTYHSPRSNKCEVCFAGAVMANRMKIEPACEKRPEDFDDKTANRLKALDHFRHGAWEEGLEYWYGSPSAVTWAIAERMPKIVFYEDDKGKFKRQMAAAARKMKKLFEMPVYKLCT